MLPGKVIELIRYLYGIKQSPCDFFQVITTKLEDAVFESIYNVLPRLFMSDKVVCLVYIDDTLLFSP